MSHSISLCLGSSTKAEKKKAIINVRNRYNELPYFLQRMLKPQIDQAAIS